MREFIDSLLLSAGIELTGALPLSECVIGRSYLLKREGIKDGTCIVFAIPYLSRAADTSERNISAYAVSRDYHMFVRELGGLLLPALYEKYPGNRFALFADHSPIDERDAAVKCGIGSFGDNRLIMNEKYSSFFFLAELITDAVLPKDGPTKEVCLHCGKCKSACPMTVYGCDCFSAITQKRGELSEDEENLIRRYKCAWGCDICQDVCPITVAARRSGTLYTKIPFFCDHTTPHLTSELIEAMEEDDFLCRAYSWRGRDVVLRNLSLLEREEKSDDTKETDTKRG